MLGILEDNLSTNIDNINLLLGCRLPYRPVR